MSDGVYAEMIEIPVSTCEMVILPKKRKKAAPKRRAVKREDFPSESKVGAGMEYLAPRSEEKREEKIEEKRGTKPARAKRKFSFDVVSAEVVAIFVLIVSILVTNIFWDDSGINNLIRGVFHTESGTEQKADNRDYSDFTVYSPSRSGAVTLSGGVMTVDGAGAIYSPCAGVVSELTEKDGKYTITVRHSDLFKTIIKNADYAYFELGETVFREVPLCYSYSGGAEVLLYNNNTLLTNYTIVDGAIIWES